MKLSIKVKRLVQIMTFVLVVTLLSNEVFSIASVAAASGSVVGTGTPDSCSEKLLDQALTNGGDITFNCGVTPVVITTTTEKGIAQNTTLDGGGVVTISGAGARRIFSVKSGITLELLKITLAYGAANDSTEGTQEKRYCPS